MRYAYKVVLIESERGWGSKIDEIKYFDTPEEVGEFVKKFNSYNTQTVAPDWYMYAEGPKLVKLDDKRKEIR